MRLRDGISAIAADTTAASLRRLHSMALELYCTVDSRMHFVELNPAWERTLGWSLAEMRAHPFEWFVHPEDVAATREVAQRILAKGGEIQGFENRYRCKDGSYRHLSWVSSFVDGVFLASARDITDEVRTRESMQRKGEALAAVAEMQSRFINVGANPAWWEYTLGRLLALTGSEYGFIGTIGEDADGPFLRTKSLTNIAWSDETRAFYAAHAPAGLVFRNMKTLFGDAILHRRIVVANDVANDPRAGGRPAGHPPLDTFLALPIGEGEHMVGLVGLANRAGGYDPATVELLQPVRILLDAILRNVAAAHERSTAEARLRAVIDSAIDAIVTIDENGIIVAANPALARLLGYQIDEVLGRNLAIFMEAPHREAHDGYLARYRETGRKGGGGVVGVGREVTAVRKDGSTVPIEVVVTEYVIEGRKQFTGIMRDISARRRAEAQQRQIEAERAAFARRLAATKELQERVLEASSSGLLVLRADGRCAFSNSRLRDLVPLAAGLADAPGPALGIAKAVERLFPNQPAVRGLLGDAPAADGQRTVVRLTLRGDGGDIPVEVGASSIEIDDEAGGRERGLLLTVNDLREQEAMRAQQLLNATLENRVSELRRHQAQNEITSECVELLQNSMSLEEGMNVLSSFAERLFPEATATLYARTGEGEELVRLHHVERHAGPAPQPTMDVVQCWALRTRRAYATWPGRGYVPCQHSREHEGGIVLCAPIVSLSNSVGLLTVRMPEAKGLGLSDDGMKAVFSQFQATVQSVSGAMSAIALRESLQRLALIDELTQVPNRRAFQGDAARAIARMRRTGEPFVVALLDIDHFKSINDTLGHEEGDRTLQQVARLMRDFFREGDLIGRIGGEEFAILLPGASPDSGARRLEQLLVRLRSTPIVAGRPVTASVGFIACVDAGKHEYDELMRRADEALYRAKETGRDRIVRAQ